MNKKVIKKKKLKIFNFLIFIVVVLLISFFIKLYKINDFEDFIE